ncbi:MAG TPA: VOC family protein, partial [Acidimicrobiales bacterium]|nr:VOC family protein [Acidimicrobiales bacterium]
VLKVANFWSAVLGRPLDGTSSSVWASIGGTDAARAEPAWYFNLVSEPKAAKNRVHLDLTATDADAVGWLVELGATLVAEHELDNADHRWTVMSDPEGNEFCVADKSFTGWT